MCYDETEKTIGSGLRMVLRMLLRMIAMMTVGDDNLNAICVFHGTYLVRNAHGWCFVEEFSELCNRDKPPRGGGGALEPILSWRFTSGLAAKLAQTDHSAVIAPTFFSASIFFVRGKVKNL